MQLKISKVDRGVMWERFQKVNSYLLQRFETSLNTKKIRLANTFPGILMSQEYLYLLTSEEIQRI